MTESGQATGSTKAGADLRLGPRPLPLHLLAATNAWTSSWLASRLWKNESLPWSPQLEQRAAALVRESASLPADDLQRALEQEILDRSEQLLAAIQTYRTHSYRRPLTTAPAVWSEGTTRLLDYGTGDADALPVLVVPSLINRSYILDLTPEGSLLRWLAGQGVTPLLVDWDAPGEVERSFSLTDYIAGRLEAALDHCLARFDRPVMVMGYCMGGLLALALALRRQRDVAGLALLASPWDFHTVKQQAVAAQSSLLAFGPWIDMLGELPVDAIQSLFAAIDPLDGTRKFLAFGRMDPASDRAHAFVALEDWLNDGVPLAGPVARECLGGWYGQNSTAKLAWRVAGRAIDPRALSVPCLCLVPGQDRIVPPGSAAAIAPLSPHIDLREPAIGHIGMVVSRRAPETIWEPLVAWLRETDAKAEVKR